MYPHLAVNQAFTGNIQKPSATKITLFGTKCYFKTNNVQHELKESSGTLKVKPKMLHYLVRENVGLQSDDCGIGRNASSLQERQAHFY